MLRALSLLLALLLLATTAHAQPIGCSPELLRWAARCGEAQRLTVRVSACPGDDLAVLSAHAGDAPALRIELARRRQGFRAVGDLSLSPIGEFPDWLTAPATLRDTFERVAACAQNAPPARMRGGALPSLPIAANVPTPQRAPWLLALALIVAIAFSHKELRRISPRDAALLAGGLGVTLALRAALHPTTYFHQNGQGPLWIEHLFTSGHHPYGPGFAELFAAVAHRRPDAPERAVFAAQSLLAATQPACAWLIARALGASPWTAGALCLTTLLDPSLGRGARSESYLASGTSLALLATVAMTRAGGRWWPHVVAGALLAQAVRIHPGLWVPMALTPLCAGLVPGTPRARALAVGRALLVVGGVVALSSAGSVLAVLRSDLAAQWMFAQARGGKAPWAPMALGLAAVAALAAKPRTRATAPPVALAVLAVLAWHYTDNYTRSGSPLWITTAYARVFLPLALSAIAALLVALPTEPPRDRTRALILGALLIAATNLPRRPLTALPTDAIELQRAWTWRAQLPRGARVFFVARAGNYVLGLPIHDGGGRDLRALSLDITDAPPDLRAFGPGTWYYRSSLCAAPPAQAWCDALERAHHLQPTFTAEIPAAPSMRHLTYTTPRVRVGLYRLTE